MKNKTFTERVLMATDKANELLNAVTDLEQGKDVKHAYISGLIADILMDELELIKVIRRFECEKIYEENLLIEDS